MINSLEEIFKRFIEKSFKNKQNINNETSCRCYYCLKTFKGKDIKEWVTELKGEQTALCPHCSIDAVIPENQGIDINDTQLFKTANQQNFQRY